MPVSYLGFHRSGDGRRGFCVIDRRDNWSVMLIYVIAKTNMGSPRICLVIPYNKSLFGQRRNKEVIIFRRNGRYRADGNSDRFLASGYRAIL